MQAACFEFALLLLLFLPAWHPLPLGCPSSFSIAHHSTNDAEGSAILVGPRSPAWPRHTLRAMVMR